MCGGGWANDPRAAPPGLASAGGPLAAAGALVLAAAFATVPEALPAAWLTAAWVPVSLGAGALSLLAVLALTGGAWGRALEPALRALAALLPVGLLLMVPLLFAGAALFPWAGPEHSAKVAAKLAYLNLPFLSLRFLVAAAVLVVADLWALARGPGWSGAAGPVLVLVGVVLATAVLDVDLMLSLQPEVVSTIHPMLQITAQATFALALAVMWHAARRDAGREADDIAERAGHMLLGFLILWGYMAYMQWLVIWAENLPFEIEFYLPRLTPGWKLWLWAGFSPRPRAGSGSASAA